MLSPIAIIAALAGMSSCSAPTGRPRAARAPSKSPQLGVFMKTYMNPPFSKISFLLFHDGDGDSEIDAAQLPASANDLAKTADRLTQWSDLPGESPQSKQVFSEYATALKADTINLVNALREAQPDSAIKVFESLRKKCDSCHHFFRYDETSSVRSPTGMASVR